MQGFDEQLADLFLGTLPARDGILPGEHGMGVVEDDRHGGGLAGELAGFAGEVAIGAEAEGGISGEDEGEDECRGREGPVLGALRFGGGGGGGGAAGMGGQEFFGGSWGRGGFGLIDGGSDPDGGEYEQAHADDEHDDEGVSESG